MDFIAKFPVIYKETDYKYSFVLNGKVLYIYVLNKYEGFMSLNFRQAVKALGEDFEEMIEKPLTKRDRVIFYVAKYLSERTFRIVEV